MKNLLTALGLLCCFTARGIEIYITFNPQNCITCSATIYNLSQEKYINTIHVVLREMYREDTADMEELYNFKEYPKLQIRFSDSIYHSLSRLEFDAELVLLKGGKELYRTNMKKVDLAVIRSYFGAGAKVDSVCSSFYPKMSGFRMEGRFIFSSNTFNKWSVLDVVTQKEILLGYKDSLKIPLYKALYKADFEKRYPVAQQQTAFAPSLKPGMDFMHRWDDNNLMVIFNLKDYGINGKDTFLFSNNVITKFDLETQNFMPYHIDNNVTKNFSLWDCHIINNRYYFEGLHKLDYLPALLEMKCDEATKTFSLIRDIPIKRPEKYKALQVPGYYEDNTVIRGGLCAFIFDNKLLRLDDGKQVAIPFDEPDRKVYNKYEIRDLQQDTANYYVLYAQDSLIHALRFSKKGKEKKDVVIQTVSKFNYWQMCFFSARNRVIYKPKDKSCLLVKEIEW